MTDTLTPIGELTLGVALPAVSVAFGNEMLNVEAQVSAMLEFAPSPPSFELDLEVAAENTQALTLAVGLGITPPSIDAQILEVEAQLAVLLGQLGELRLLAAMLAASAHLYVYAGSTGALGTKIDAELSGGLPGGAPTDVAFAVLLVATAPAGKAALQSLFKVTP